MYQASDSLDPFIDAVLETYPSYNEENKTPSLEVVDEELKNGGLKGGNIKKTATDNQVGFDLNLEQLKQVKKIEGTELEGIVEEEDAEEMEDGVKVKRVLRRSNSSLQPTISKEI